MLILLNGNLGFVRCINVLLIVLLLNDSLFIICCVVFLFLLNKYKFKGFGFLWIKVIVLFNDWYVKIGKIGLKIFFCIIVELFVMWFNNVGFI